MRRYIHNFVCLILLGTPASVFAIPPLPMEQTCWSMLTHQGCADRYTTYCQGQSEPVCLTSVDTCGATDCVFKQIGSGCFQYPHDLGLPYCFELILDGNSFGPMRPNQSLELFLENLQELMQ